MIKSEYLLFGLLLGVLVALSLPTVAIAVTPYDWDWMDCHDHGWYKGHYNTSKNEPDHCVCYNPERWDGVDCSLCTGDKSCEKGQKCLNHFDVNQHNYFNCKAQDPAKLFHINGSITAEFHFDDCVHGYASLNIFDKPTGAPLDFNCSIVDCVKSTDDSDQVKVTCSNIKCHCTEWCSTFVAAIIDNAIKGETTFSCVKSTGVCHVRTPPLLDALLICEAAVCETPFACGIPPTPKPLSAGWKALISIGSIVGGSAIVVATVFLIMFICRKRTQIRNQHWATFDHTKVPATLSFTEVSCFVKTGLRGATKQILHGVSGMARPGQITAIMGASGGGKTTLIDILAGRKSLGTVEGDILINGEKRKKSFKRMSGYVLQDDIMMGTLTVREQVTYSAMLRLPSIMPNEEKLNRVDSILNELGISHIANSLIGTDMTRGISGGERKRVSIATELVTEPSLLFLDEPTSGLDAYNASALMETLKKLALQHNTTVVMSIHQPRSDIFHQFDSLLVLSHGKTVFSGTPQDVVPYFAELGHVCPQNYNPADFIIDTITLHPNLVDDDIKMANGSQGKTRIYRWPKDKNGQIQGGSDDGEIDEDEEIPKHHMDERTKKYMKKEFASSFWTQLNILCQRTFKNILRNPYLLRAQYILTCCLSVLVGLIFKDLSYDLYGVQGRAGCLFFLLCLLSFSCMSSLDTFFHERALFVRERAQGAYRTSSYFLAKTICDILPMRVVPPIILGTVCYWMMTHPQTQPEWVHYLWCIVVLVLVSVVACTMCLFISCSCPSMAVSNLVAILVLLFFMLFGGLLANKTTIPPFINWFRWLSFINYGYEILMVNELQGTTINFNPPHVDPIPVTGEEFLEQFDMDINRWQMDTGVLIAMAGGYLILSYLFLRFHIKERR